MCLCHGFLDIVREHLCVLPGAFNQTLMSYQIFLRKQSFSSRGRTRGSAPTKNLKLLGKMSQSDKRVAVFARKRWRDTLVWLRGRWLRFRKREFSITFVGVGLDRPAMPPLFAQNCQNGKLILGLRILLSRDKIKMDHKYKTEQGVKTLLCLCFSHLYYKISWRFPL